jgi:hypothetical protein
LRLHVSRLFWDRLQPQQEANVFLLLFLQKKKSLLSPLTRWLTAAAANTLRQTVAERPREVVFIASAGSFLLFMQFASLHNDLAENATAIAPHWRLLAIGGAAVSVALGYSLGVLIGRYSKDLSERPWLAVLPWPEPARREAAWTAALWLGAIPAVLLGALVLIMAQSVAFSWAAWAGAASVLFHAALAVSARRAIAKPARAETARSETGAGASALSHVLTPFDQAPPRWLGSWAIRRKSAGLLALWAASLAVLGGGADVIAWVQHWIWPGFVASVVGGHGFFLAALDMRPLLSPAVRGQPIPYGRAVAALFRLPLGASFAWFAQAVLPVVALPGGVSRLPAAALLLLAVNLQAGVCFCIVPGSRRQGLALYGIGIIAILQQTAEYGVAYGWLIAVPVAALAVYLLARARRRFRAHA